MERAPAQATDRPRQGLRSTAQFTAFMFQRFCPKHVGRLRDRMILVSRKRDWRTSCHALHLSLLGTRLRWAELRVLWGKLKAVDVRCLAVRRFAKPLLVLGPCSCWGCCVLLIACCLLPAISSLLDISCLLTCWLLVAVAVAIYSCCCYCCCCYCCCCCSGCCFFAVGCEHASGVDGHCRRVSTCAIGFAVAKHISAVSLWSKFGASTMRGSLKLS